MIGHKNEDRRDRRPGGCPASILFIHPPVAKPSEPPAGISKLAGALQAHDMAYSVVDANLDGMLFLLEQPSVLSDTWTRRATRSMRAHLGSLRTPAFYSSIDRYRRAVRDIGRLLAAASHGFNGLPGLCDYNDSVLSPVRSQDLLYSAEHPESNPFYRYMDERLRPKTEAAQAGVVGISISYLSQALTGFAMAGFIKRHFPETAIVMGGSLITSWMTKGALKQDFSGLIDRFVSGPGEAPLLQLLGVPHEAKESYPPSYDRFRHQDYLSPGFVLPYATSSGCYWGRCSFCPERAEGIAFKPTPPSVATEHLSALTKQTEPALIHLVDNALSPSMLKALVEHPPGAPWYGFVRTTPELTDPRFCRSLKQSGCVMLKLGVESGDQSVLNYLEKGTTVAMSSQALKALHSAGISTYVYLLFGTPPETRAEAEKTLAFTAAHYPFIDFLNVALFNLPVNSPEAAVLKTDDFYEGDCALYADFTHPAGWDRREVRRFLDKEFKRHPAIASILRNQPPFFTSNHAPFFAIHRR